MFPAGPHQVTQDSGPRRRRHRRILCLQKCTNLHLPFLNDCCGLFHLMFLVDLRWRPRLVRIPQRRQFRQPGYL